MTLSHIGVFSKCTQIVLTLQLESSLRIVINSSGVKRILLCFALGLPVWADVQFTKQPGRIEIQIGGKPFSTFYFGPETMKPYLHPLRAADGTIVTRRYPMEQVEGESRDHPHHQGLWFSHGDVNGLDFWGNVKPGPKFGKIQVVSSKPMRVQGGSKTGIIEGDFEWLDPNGKPLLNEHRKMTFYDDPDDRKIDIDITLTATDAPVKFGDTKEGTFAIRLTDKFTEKSKGALMTSSSGATGMKHVWGKAFPWVDYAGTLDGKELGVTIFDHPANPKHPTYWHARDYGLFAANIFGEHDFFNDKSRDGSVVLEPGKSMRFRYRVLIHPGLTDIAKLNAAYDAYKRANAK